MPNTRKKIIKTVYNDDNESNTDPEDPFIDSGSEAYISEIPTSEEENNQEDTSGEEFVESKISRKPIHRKKKETFSKCFIRKINKQTPVEDDNEHDNILPTPFSIKDLTDEDKLLPSVLNLSESDTSDDEPAIPEKSTLFKLNYENEDSGSDDAENKGYKDVWSNNKDDSEEIARKTFLELEQQKSKYEETKAYVSNYTSKLNSESNVKDLLALGEEVISAATKPTKKKSKRVKDESDSEMEDWEEVKESKSIPPQGIQLIVDIPGAISRKTKTIDVEMMMKRKMNRVKKEYQVYMHKVHVLCWLGHGNYVSRALNNQDLMAASLSLVPSKECYPGNRVDIKYVEQITLWYKDKLTFKQDKNENKFRTKAPPLKDLLISQIKSRTCTTKKYLVYIFVCMLRALGLQCRIMFNFVTLPIKPPSSELCSLSTKTNDDKNKCKSSATKKKSVSKTSKETMGLAKTQKKEKIIQLDGTDYDSCDIFTNIVQLDGNNDDLSVTTRSSRIKKQKNTNNTEDNVSPPKRAKKTPSPKLTKSKEADQLSKSIDIESKQNPTLKTERTQKSSQSKDTYNTKDNVSPPKRAKKIPRSKLTKSKDTDQPSKSIDIESNQNPTLKTERTPKSSQSKDSKLRKRNNLSCEISENEQKETCSNKSKNNKNTLKSVKANLVQKTVKKEHKNKIPEIVITKANDQDESSKYFSPENNIQKNKGITTRKASRNASASRKVETGVKEVKCNKKRTKSDPGTSVEKSKYFSDNNESTSKLAKKPKLSLNKTKKDDKLEDLKRVSHRNLAKTKQTRQDKYDVTGDLVHIIKGRIKEAKQETRNKIVKGKLNKESDEDSDYLPEEDPKVRKADDSGDEFKPTKISPKPSSSKKIDRRVLSSDDDAPKNKIDVWCEVFVEELEQWIPVDVIKGKVHCAESIYSHATHPVCYIVGWDNNNYLKDLTRRYVPHWNTITRKLRAEPAWWSTATKLWLGPNTARNKEENEQLDRMQLEAPLPKSIAEYKNHPLYALKRHLLKFEAIYPPDAAVLGFVRNEPVYARECVYTCRSRDTWLKEAKVVRLGEQPYKIVKARPKWDKLSNKMITDKALEIYGPWQVQDYEPPEAANGIVPRNAYGNVELFKACMLPKGTAHIKLPGLNKVAKKLNIDCAPAMTGFDFNGGWSHPVFEGFVVCKEFEELIKEAWVNDQEDQERKEQEKNEARIYGNWRRLIKGIFIRERLRAKYGFEEPSTSGTKKSKGPRLVVKKT